MKKISQQGRVKNPGHSLNELAIRIQEEIPTLPTVVTRILNLVLDDKSSVKDISEVVRVDQALVSKVLKVVNSAAYGLREKVSTVDHAMTILGFDTLKKLFLCLSIFDNLSQENEAGYFFQKSQFWCHSLAVATVARGIASLIQYPSPNEAYVAGLMHDVGKIIIEQTMPEEYHNYIKKINFNPDMSLRFEEENLSVNHASVGNLAFEKWNLPLALRKAVELHHGTSGCAVDRESDHGEMDTLAAIVSVADFICWTQALGSFNFFLHPTLNPQAEKIVNLKELKIEPVLEEMNKEITLNAKVFNLELNDLKGFREALQRANLALGKINSLYDDASKRLENHIQQLNILNKVIYKARETLEPSQVINNVLQGVGEGFGFPRLIWFSVNATEKRVITKATYGEFPGNLPITTSGCSLDEEIGIPLSTCIQNKKIITLKYDQDDGENSSRALQPCEQNAITTEPYSRALQHPETDAIATSYLSANRMPLERASRCLLKSLQNSGCAIHGSLLLVPISTDQGVTNLLLIDNQGESVAISSDTIKVIDILAMNLGMALENAELFHRTAQMAIIDPLTGIYNRRQLDSSLTNEINRAARFQQSFSIALFDIDHFKIVNDTYGHQVGDIILKDVSAVIKNNSRNTDIVGRLGGDEFLVILPNTQMQGALTCMDRVRLVVEKYGSFRQKSYPKCQITLSIGLAEFNNSLDTPERLLNKADKALYQSKQKGKNRVSVFKE
jgi:two-component system, cell cycle response regulator